MQAIGTTSRAVIDPVELAGFREDLKGHVLAPGEERYETARAVWNTAYDRRPALIVRAADADDVARTVRLARDSGLPLAVRSGGHSMAAHCTVDDGIVLDLRDMRALDIDPERRLAWAEPGLTSGELTAAAHAHGLTVPFGDTASVGIGGITLGGGIGWLARKHGMTIDHLASVEIVTADGQQLTASAEENPDLFWALRGGGGNFGVVTRFQYRLQPLDMVLGGAIVLPATRDIVRSIVRIAESAPDELTVIAMLMHAPPAPFIPADQHGALVVMVGLVYAGDPEEGQRAVAPFRALATPVADLVSPMPYPAIYQLTAEGSEPMPSTARSMFMRTLDDGTIDAMFERLSQATSPMAMVQIRVLGGAMSRVSADATAFGHRNEPILLAIITPFMGAASAADHVAWTEDFWAHVSGNASGAYTGFLADEGEARIRQAYPSETYARLRALKRRYDPTNLFRVNQNIQPSPA
ncbi:FAD-binding oxidoreductase [soil metagenome]